jgi:hypothetical protein
VPGPARALAGPFGLARDRPRRPGHVAPAASCSRAVAAAAQQQRQRRRSSGSDAAVAAAMELKLAHGECALQRVRESEARQRERRVRELGARAWLNGGQGDAGGCISVASIGRSEQRRCSARLLGHS